LFFETGWSTARTNPDLGFEITPRAGCFTSMKPSWVLGALGLLILTGLASAAEPPHVTVTQHPAKITRHTFDPKHPPAAMPKLTPSESGVCHFEFTCDAGIGVFVDEKGPGSVEVEIDTVDLVLDLPIDIWVMNNAPQKLMQHEEGHRRICEDYYKGCEAIARNLAQKMVGRKAIGTGKNKLEAQNDAQHKLLSELNTAYLRATRVPCKICQDHYDDITTHGLKPISEDDAIVQAKALQAAGKLPSTGMPVEDPIVTKG
jgi:hypothetical protein